MKSHATRFADHHSDAGEKPRPRKNPKLVPERNISKLEDEANFVPDYELGDSDQGLRSDGGGGPRSDGGCALRSDGGGGCALRSHGGGSALRSHGGGGALRSNGSGALRSNGGGGALRSNRP